MNTITVKVKTKNNVSENLINDGGMDMLALNYTAECFENIQAGTGTRINKRYDEDALVEVGANGEVVSNLDIFEQDDATHNRLIRYGTFFQYVGLVTTYITDNKVAITPIGSDSIHVTEYATTAMICYTEETTLETPTIISSTYDTSTGHTNGTVVEIEGNTLRVTTTRDFSLGVGPLSLTEFGWSPTSTLGDPVFGRIVYDTPLEWEAAEDAIVSVSIVREYDCEMYTQSNIFSSINTPMDNKFLADYYPEILSSISSVDDTGTTVIGANASVSFLECVLSGTVNSRLSESATSLLNTACINEAGIHLASEVTIDPYVSKSYTKTLRVSFDDTWRSKKWRTFAIMLTTTLAQYKGLFTKNVTYDGVLSNVILELKWNRG